MSKPRYVGSYIGTAFSFRKTVGPVEPFPLLVVMTDGKDFSCNWDKEVMDEAIKNPEVQEVLHGIVESIKHSLGVRLNIT